MAFTTLQKTQKEFLEEYLRGTNREISSAQAEATYGIQNLRARMSELRHAGLRVRTGTNTQGRTTYSISRRNVVNDQSKIYA
jgi:hypothetical protein